MLLRSPKSLTILALAFVALAAVGARCPLGLDPQGFAELHAVGVDRYVGRFQPADSYQQGAWTKYRFDTQDGNGPECLDGTPFAVYTQVRDPSRVAIYFTGGGACWTGMPSCAARVSATPPDATGIFNDSYTTESGEEIDNPLADWSMVVVGNCDGSFFGGDNDVVDPDFAWGGVRHHRGVRNATAALDLAHDLFPNPDRVLLAGTSAGAYGVLGVVPLIARFEWLNTTRLYLFADSGAGIYNLAETEDVAARAQEWGFAQFYPTTCDGCAPDAQPTELFRWLLDRDAQVRSALYTTDGDLFLRYYLRLATQAQYRELLLSVHDPIQAAFPDRYARFIRSGSKGHAILEYDAFYQVEIDGQPLYRWLRDFVEEDPGWGDLVEAWIPVP
jgi:pectinacetylesterase